MDYSSEEDTDISESEIEEYEEKSYEELKSGNRSLKISDVAYTCPYCPKKRKRDFLYKELVQHASGVGSCSSNKRTAREKANHLALAKYLENEVTVADDSSKPDAVPDPQADPLADHDRDEMFVWPWIGVVVNIPTEFKDGRYVGESGSKLRDMLTRRGFNPTRVRPLWNYQGHSGTALVEFNKDWSGFGNAMSYEKAYEADHHGKRDWKANLGNKSDLYAWIARADDYKALNIVGENLRKVGDLRTISDIMEEEARKTDKLVSNLTNVIEVKKLHLKEMEDKFKETAQSLNKLVEEKDKLHQAYNEEIRKIQSSARDHFQKIFNDHEKLKLQLESQKEELELRGRELEQREAKNEIDRKKLSEELEQGLKELPRVGPIGVKRMGELDNRPFHEAMKRKYHESEADERATELCSLWEEYLRDPGWHPIRVAMVNGKHENVIDDEDEKLKELKKNHGVEVYKAVTAALTEINDYNPSGRYIISELWNYAVNKKATLEEGVNVLLNVWKKKRGPD
ncbi:protein INVOLVED IN DE NOVO 2 isoform X2 [Lycium barbarum]|uniref:protein INVOLVED IN DE NOVO 2 isoform X2 n=1 Tax=Lycium barbarum TaxID=112863 RepID=UPI00293EED04|nr:protein INVOLVED IN DE NOVO 2 isoform X2 [Lycium barbarum]